MSRQTARLDAAIRNGGLPSSGGAFTPSVDFPAPSPGPSFGQRAVRERATVRVARRVLVARRGTVPVRLACPRETRAGCAGRVEIRTSTGARIGTATRRHRVRAGRSATVAVRLTGAARRTPGARQVLVRVVERGLFGPKTSGVVLPLAVPRS